MRWPKYWSFSLNISPSNEHTGLISFRMDLLDLLAVQGTLKSLLQHHSSKASILRCSAFFIVQLSHSYKTTGKTVSLTRWTFVGKVMSLLFNMLSRLVITFLPRSKRLLISGLQSPSAMILEPPKIKSDTVSTVSPSISHEVMGPDRQTLFCGSAGKRSAWPGELHGLNCFVEWFSSVQFSSVAQSCPTLCDPMNRSTPGLPVHHQFPEFTETHVHRVSDAIQPSHPLSSPSPPAPNPSQHQSLFQ